MKFSDSRKDHKNGLIIYDKYGDRIKKAGDREKDEIQEFDDYYN